MNRCYLRRMVDRECLTCGGRVLIEMMERNQELPKFSVDRWTLASAGARKPGIYGQLEITLTLFTQ